jgi:hypothetical protein
MLHKSEIKIIFTESRLVLFVHEVTAISLSLMCFTTLFLDYQGVMNFKGFGRNQSGLIVIRNVLGPNYKNRENLILGLGPANAIQSPVVYGFEATPANNSTIL